MTEQQYTPELRFPEFVGNWITSKLTLVTTLLKDGTHGTHKDVEIGPWLLSAKNIKNNKITIVENDRKISQTDFNKIYKNYNLRTDDLLLSIVGTIGNVALVKNPYNIAFQRSVAILRFKDCFSSLYFLYLFQTFTFKKKLKRNQVVSAQPGIYLGDLGKFEINIPEYNKEQVKIGVFFSKLDRQIELEEDKLELLEQQKKGYMQKIFSQELRFKDENGEVHPGWKLKKLNDIANVYQPQNLSQNKFQEKGYPVYGANGVIGYYKDFNHNDTEIAIACRGNTCGRVNLTEPKSWITSNAMVVNILDKKETEFYFLYQYLRIINYDNVISGSGQPQITRKNMNSIELLMPNYVEQQKIGNFLVKIDELILRQDKKIELLKQRKQGLLQKMFI
ncbi:restriction endonuclease subunit S [Staphylococcus haemolyticus]|uniref:restriction endonuclease subunit S n=1 Tax=Staphylococcus haemolyticus TaxID=1283 RepID=UPI00069D3F1B|nr:restriction endonuclease subunit S [Staphylococcus haemolyticus]MBC3104387.1 restriction endonuclease subunit S [Staphylococcus haemolyticus]MCT1687397.1 restriction endonuclease subunit S [Staphylococcus haemolyticus]MCT1755730.1 restriction endonuclease subunit S [Staphylococcus haemolyticus]MDT3948008.1 restriction endonuclease subunit S [Staphylococcus haemolyticus]MEB6745924.1 restriction endonuclease subunit S [Staphylococcus haemolyticus]